MKPHQEVKTTAAPRTWHARIAWLLGIWAGSVVALGVAARLLKGVMRLAGLA
jgi:hypothetical protein